MTRTVAIRKFDRNALRARAGAAHWPSHGRVRDVIGNLIRAHLDSARHGSTVEILVGDGQPSIFGEVVGFDEGKVMILPFGSLAGISPGCEIRPYHIMQKLNVGEYLLGQVVDPFLNPLGSDDFEVPKMSHSLPLERPAPDPMHRSRITTPLSLGIRAIDALLTFGEGQRIGIMAGSGVGKSVLLGMIAKGSSADVNVIGLIGERGREVREFIEKELGEEGRARSVVVVVTSDQSPLMKIRAAKVVTTIAEYFSARGSRVLLMMDSLTRVATAQREIGLAVGEPPTTKGFPPSVFTLLPRILERCGPQGRGKGSISGLYTVLVDGDDFNDPMPDAARGILDGHIVLSRSLANRGHFPAIDVSASTSRTMYDIVSEEHWQKAARMKALLSAYHENFDYVQIGSYQSGTNPDLDDALRLMPQIDQFLRQGRQERGDLQQALAQLTSVLGS